MSNHLAIAACTAALGRVLAKPAEKAVSGAGITYLRPDASPDGAVAGKRINVFLYQVTPNAAWRNADLPARSNDGTLRQRPQAALDLWYLLSFFGEEAQLEPQRLLGSAVSALHTQPVLTREQIRKARDEFPGDPIAKSNLDEQVELIKFSPTSLNLEDLSRLWTMFVKAPYALSLSYQASVVLIESDISVQSALPVRRRNLYVDPFRRPVLDEVTAEAGAAQPILPGERLIARGHGLRGDLTQVWIDGVEITPDFVSETELRLQVPMTSVQAGVAGVQVVQPRLLGTPPSSHRGLESNVVPIVVRPVLEEGQDGKLGATFGSGTQNRELTVPINPPVGAEQKAVLLLSPLPDTPGGSVPPASAPVGYSIPALPRETGPVIFDLKSVKAGTYLVRVQVDGAESLVEVDDQTGKLAQPWLEVLPEAPL